MNALSKHTEYCIEFILGLSASFFFQVREMERHQFREMKYEPKDKIIVMLLLFLEESFNNKNRKIDCRLGSLIRITFKFSSNKHLCS